MASASCTSNSTRPYAEFIKNLTNPEARYQPTMKEPGSKKLVHGEWVTVKPGDEDAVKEKGPVQSDPGGEVG